jgi:tRNA G10  N-methylase Trm11
MGKYILIFGRDEKLSFIELISYFNCRKISFRIEKNFGGVLVVNLPGLDFKKMIKELGGVVKIGKIINDFSGLYKGNKSRVNYGISVYKEGKDIKDDLKRYFRKEGLKSILKKPKRGGVLSPSEVIKNNLIEIIVYRNYVAKTIAVFDPFEYERRDLGRPKKDFIRMSSIRLSKILVNLSQTKGKLLDPFCGYGTILQEAMLNGLNVIGCDNDVKAIEDCKKNLEWLKKKYDINRTYKLFTCDVKDLSKYIGKINGVATEPYLGPYLKRRPSYDKAMKIVGELTGIYASLLRELSKIVVKEGKVAMIVPRFRTSGNRIVKINFSKLVEENKFKICSFMNIKIPIIYLHKILEREIWVLER